MAGYLSIRDIDWPLLLIVLLICAVGVLQIYSATLDTGFHSAWWKQILYIGGGLVLMWLVLAGGLPLADALRSRTVQFRRCWRCWRPPSWASTVFGSRRWIPLPGRAFICRFRNLSSW